MTKLRISVISSMTDRMPSLPKPLYNLFLSIIDRMGVEGLQRFRGGADLGKHSAGWGTFWNIRSANPVEYPRENFGPWSMNLVGFHSEQEASTSPTGKWFEPIKPNELFPPNIHEAQLQKRLKQ